MQCVILAGGIGSRMWPETRRVPKTLLPVNGRAFAGWQLEWLAAGGIESVVYCIGHLGGQVRDYVGDGAAWGLAVDYVDEGTDLRGTAGALRLAYEADRLAADFLVLYGDSWLQVNPGDVLRRARRTDDPALMTVFENDGRWDGSNVIYQSGRVVRYAKGLAVRPPDMRWIDYGLMAFRRGLIADRVPSGEVVDLAPLLTELAAQNALAGFAVQDRFYEIGSVDGRAELEEFLNRRAAPSRADANP